MSYSLVGWWVLWVVVVLCLVFLYRPRRKLFVYPWNSSLGKRFYLQAVLWVLAVLGTVLLSFDIRRNTSVQPVRQSTNYTMIALDWSLSMSADDVAPSRFTRAREIISQLASGSSDHSYGLIVFSGLPVIRIPWTKDMRWFTQVVSGMQLGDFPPTDDFLGTALGDALLLALYEFQQIPEQSSRRLIIISDGDSNKWYDPYKLITLLQEQQIKVYFIALGEQGYEVGKDATGLPVITSFDDVLMEQFADQTKGEIYRNPDVAGVDQIVLDRGDDEGEEQVGYAVVVRSLNESLPMILFGLYVCIVLLYLWKTIVLQRKP